MGRMEGMSRPVLSYALWVLLRNVIITPLHLYALSMHMSHSNKGLTDIHSSEDAGMVPLCDITCWPITEPHEDVGIPFP